MGESKLERRIKEQQALQRLALADQVKRALADEVVSLRALGKAVGVDPSQLSRFLRGKAGLSHEALVAVATGLGYDVSFRLFESTGPRIRDRLSAPMFDALLRILHPAGCPAWRWLSTGRSGA